MPVVNCPWCGATQYVAPPHLYENDCVRCDERLTRPRPRAFEPVTAASAVRPEPQAEG
jgi:hypothetical protein